METGKYVDFAAGHTGVVHLRLIPRTSISLAAPSQELTSLRTMVTLRGPIESLPDGTPLRFSWIVQRGTEKKSFAVQDLKLEAESKTVGSVIVPLDVLTHGLLGKGTVGFEVTPDFPRCKTQVSAPGTLTFDNPLSVAFSTLTGKRIGSVVTVSPSIGEIFLDAIVKLTLRERDVGEGEVQTTADMAHEITWAKGDTSPRPWRIGCAAPDGIVFDYMEDDEKGAYEIDYALSVSTDGGKSYQVVHESSQILSVPHPRLEAFELVSEDSSVWDAGFYDYWSTVIGNMSREDAQKIPVKLQRARGKLSGYDPDLGLPVQISLWTRDPDGKTTQFKAKGTAAGIEQTVRIWGDGSFDVELVNFCELTSKEDWKQINKMQFFAVLRLHPSLTGGKERAPIHRVFDFDSAVFTPVLDNGEGAGLATGTGVCTRGVQIAVTHDGKIHNSSITVGGKDFVTWFNDEFYKKPHDGLFPNGLQADGFKKVFDNLTAVSGKAAISVNEFVAHLMIMYNETGGTLKPGPEQGGDAYLFETRTITRSDGSTFTKASYNKVPEAYKAGNQLKARGIISSQADVDAWNSTTSYPASASQSVRTAARECDFYKYRGRGLNQLTWRGNYEAHADDALQKAFGKTSAQMTNAELDAAFMDARVYPAAFRSFNSSKANAQAAMEKVEQGEFGDYGKLVSGSDSYRTTFSNRCKKVSDLMIKTGFES